MNRDGYPDGIRRPRLDWLGLTPRSVEYEDVYFNAARGDEESRYLYLEGNYLSERFPQARQFVVAETGFGTGLNFLICRELWSRLAPADGQLDYVSVEQFPMDVKDLRRAQSAFPSLFALGDELRAQWPPPEPGFRRLVFDEGRCRLTLVFAEVGEALAELDARVDAWFLDGFAPARNPGMWRDSVLRDVAALSAEGATFSTFTAAGDVRRALQAAGFQVERRRGFAGKRETLRGRFSGGAQVLPRAPWYARPDRAPPGPIAVIGAGLAGCTVSAALAARGREVLLFERHATPAAEASGNPAGVLMPLVSSIRGLPQRWYAGAFRFAFQRYAAMGEVAGWHPTGVLQCAVVAADVARLGKIERRKIWPEGVARCLSSSEASAAAGVSLDWPALFFPEGGWIEPDLFCLSELAAPGIESRFSTAVRGFESRASGWDLFDGGGRELARVAAVVDCTGSAHGQFPQSHGIPGAPVRGQVTLAQPRGQPVGLRTVLGGMGYVIPGVRGGYLAGATYCTPEAGVAARDADDRQNMRSLERLCPELRVSIDDDSLEGRAGIRWTTPDALPCVGPVPDAAGYRAAYPRLDLGKRPGAYPPAPCYRNLYVSGGFGSRALASVPIAAEILASAICGTPPPVERTLLHAVHPARFLVRELSRS